MSLVLLNEEPDEPEYHRLRIGRGSFDRRRGLHIKKFRCAIKICPNILEVYYMNPAEYYQCLKTARQSGWTIGPPLDLCHIHKDVS